MTGEFDLERQDEPDEIVKALEATLFAAEQPMTVEALSTHLGGAEVRPALAELQAHYENRGIRLVERGKRWHFETAPELAHLLRREKEQLRRLSRAATEVLAIIAYHEPVSRAEIEAIRGVQTAKGTLDVLMEAGWVRAAGKREVPGASRHLCHDARIPGSFRPAVAQGLAGDRRVACGRTARPGR